MDTETLAAWRARFGFPMPFRETGREYYSAADIAALQEAVLSEVSLPRAIEEARRRAGVVPQRRAASGG